MWEQCDASCPARAVGISRRICTKSETLMKRPSDAASTIVPPRRAVPPTAETTKAGDTEIGWRERTAAPGS